MKIKSIEDKVNIIDDIMSPTQIKTFNQTLGNSIHWDADLDSGTSIMRNEFFKENKIESIYEQFQLSAVERRKNALEDIELEDFTPALTHIDKINDIKNLDNLNILTKISPKAGRLVVFPSNIVHAGSHPIDNNYRIVINYNFCLKMRYGLKEYEEKRKQNYGDL
jgi:hypothetical protein